MIEAHSPLIAAGSSSSGSRTASAHCAEQHVRGNASLERIRSAWRFKQVSFLQHVAPMFGGTKNAGYGRSKQVVEAKAAAG
jgi:hypothetical protein